MKRTILLNLALLFAATQTAYCQYGGGTGTPNDPYLIYDANQMNAIGANPLDWNKHFKLMADIDLSAFTGTTFNIIGNFSGVFNGNHHEISNFTYISTDDSVTALFRSLNGANAQIKDLGLRDPNVKGTWWAVAALVGEMQDATVSGCYVEGGRVYGNFAVTCCQKYAGGLVGSAYGGLISDCYAVTDIYGTKYPNGGLVGGIAFGTSVTNCYSKGSVTGNIEVGGLVGFSNPNTVISNCYSTSSVSGTGDAVGGLVGWSYGTVSGCYATGPVSSRTQGIKVGGLMGGNGGTISNCYSTGSVSGFSYVGGLVGWAYEGLISDCYATGRVSGIGIFGGLVGERHTGTTRDSFWDIETSGQKTSAGGTGLTTAEMKTLSTFTSAAWDFNTPVWQMCDGVCYPRLAWQQGIFIGVPPVLDIGALLDGPKTVNQVLSIGSCLSDAIHWTISEDCDWLSLDVNSGTSGPFDSNSVTLTADINGLDYGFYSCDLTVTDPNAQNNPQTFPVTLHVCIYRLGEIFVPDEYSTIQHAIDAAGPNNTVMVDPGTHYDNINFSAKNITVSSIDPNDATIVANTVIDGNNQGPVVTFRNGEDANCVLAGFTITDGNDQGQGAGISCTGDYTSPTIKNCIVIANQGTGIHCDQTTPTIKNCVIAGNTDAGLVTRGRTSANIANCTIVENTGCGLDSNYGKPQITNSIIWANADGQIYGAPNVTFSDIQDGYAGLGNIDADPCFVEAGYWDVNGVWVEGDYHLLEGSPCIDAGDPNYTPEPNETDLEGNPRVLDGDEDGVALVDMGAYEYVPLQPVEAEMTLTPHALSCASKGRWVKAHVVLPEGYLPEDVDISTPAVALPMDIESEYMKVFASGKGPVSVEIRFDRQVFCEALTETGEIEVTVYGYLTTGREFYATDTIRIKPNPRQIIRKLLKTGLNKPRSGKLR